VVLENNKEMVFLFIKFWIVANLFACVLAALIMWQNRRILNNVA
jgi:hypothetical protein